MMPIVKNEEGDEDCQIIGVVELSKNSKRKNDGSSNSNPEKVKKMRQIEAKDGEGSSSSQVTHYIEGLEKEVSAELKTAQLPSWFKLGMWRLIEDNQRIRQKIRDILAKKNKKSG